MQVSSTGALARADGTVSEVVQATEGQQKALPRTDERGARRPAGPWGGVRHRGGHARRREALNTLEGEVSSVPYPSTRLP